MKQMRKDVEQFDNLLCELTDEVCEQKNRKRERKKEKKTVEVDRIYNYKTKRTQKIRITVAVKNR